MAEDFKTTCDFCKKDYYYYVAKYAAIPPAGIYNKYQENFICDECIKKYYLSTYDVFNILYQKSEIDSNFRNDLLYAIKYFIPSLFKLSRKTIPEKIRQKVFKKYNFKCVDCGSDENLTIDHVIPWSKGGSDEIGNLQCLCKRCNSKKGAK